MIIIVTKKHQDYFIETLSRLLGWRHLLQPLFIVIIFFKRCNLLDPLIPDFLLINKSNEFDSAMPKNISPFAIKKNVFLVVGGMLAIKSGSTLFVTKIINSVTLKLTHLMRVFDILYDQSNRQRKSIQKIKVMFSRVFSLLMNNFD